MGLGDLWFCDGEVSVGGEEWEAESVDFGEAGVMVSGGVDPLLLVVFDGCVAVLAGDHGFPFCVTFSVDTTCREV